MYIDQNPEICTTESEENGYATESGHAETKLDMIPDLN